MNDIYADFSDRGLIHQTTDDLAPWLNQKSRTMYIGFDPTADSMHVGHLMQVMTYDVSSERAIVQSRWSEVLLE